MSVTVTFPDGNSRSFENNVTIFEVADSISHKLAKNALAGEVDGKVMDLGTVLDHDVELKQIQMPGAKRMNAKDYLRGHTMDTGVCLGKA